ncbi:MAG: MFS transporter permease [Rhodospirillales bacterium]|nr:MFS transporter permease [Rhodospirillales bacterium]
MSEWWTYRLSDFLLFSPRTYYRLFELYNEAVFPAQFGAFALGLAILVLSRRGNARADRLAAALLAGLWLFVALAFHAARYATINWAASWFAAAFAVEAALIAWAGAVREAPVLRTDHDWGGRVGLAIFVFALCVLPLVGPLIGRPWSQIELFGLAPDPTALATLGLLAGSKKPRWFLLAIPLLWCATSGATLWTMEAPDAFVLPLVAALAFLLSIVRTFAPRAAGSNGPAA